MRTVPRKKASGRWCHSQWTLMRARVLLHTVSYAIQAFSFRNNLSNNRRNKVTSLATELNYSYQADWSGQTQSQPDPWVKESRAQCKESCWHQETSKPLHNTNSTNLVRSKTLKKKVYAKNRKMSEKMIWSPPAARTNAPSCSGLRISRFEPP